LENPSQQSSNQETEGLFLVAVVAAVAVAAVAAAACAFGLAPVCVTRQIIVLAMAVFLRLEYWYPYV
jgi:hypothetical protein